VGAEGGAPLVASAGAAAGPAGDGFVDASGGAAAGLAAAARGAAAGFEVAAGDVWLAEGCTFSVDGPPRSPSRRATAASKAASSRKITSSASGGFKERNWPIKALCARS
jgi:hypothetical protein